jgi:hypothetical protein
MPLQCSIARLARLPEDSDKMRGKGQKMEHACVMPAPKGNKFALGNKGNTETSYDPAFCVFAIKLGKKGAGIEELAVEIGVMRKTIYAWMETHEEFGNAVTMMLEIAEVHWRKIGKDALFTPAFRDRLYTLQMMNRFSWNKKTENTEKGGLAEAMRIMAERALQET